MELRQLRNFLVLVDERHFGRAAARQHLSQPALSRQIGALEREVGRRLLDRHGRQVELTTAGREFARHARVAVARAEDAEAAIRSMSRMLGLELHLGLFASGNPPVANDIVRTLLADPNLLLLVRPGSAEQHLDSLLRHRLDAAFLIAPTEPPEELTLQVVHQERIMVGLPDGHPLTRQSWVPVASLRGEPVVARHLEGTPTQLDALMVRVATRLVPQRRSTDLMEAEARLDAVAAGIGCTLVLESAAHKFDVIGVTYRPLEPPAFVDCVVAWPKAAAKLPSLRRLITAVDVVLSQRTGNV